MGSTDRADEEMDMVALIKKRVEFGDYSVDPQAVATAMLARCGALGDSGGCKGGRRPPLTALRWSEVLVAAQPVGGDARERKTLTGHDPA